MSVEPSGDDTTGNLPVCPAAYHRVKLM